MKGPVTNSPGSLVELVGSVATSSGSSSFAFFPDVSSRPVFPSFRVLSAFADGTYSLLASFSISYPYSSFSALSSVTATYRACCVAGTVNSPFELTARVLLQPGAESPLFAQLPVVVVVRSASPVEITVPSTTSSGKSPDFVQISSLSRSVPIVSSTMQSMTVRTADLVDGYYALQVLANYALGTASSLFSLLVVPSATAAALVLPPHPSFPAPSAKYRINADLPLAISLSSAASSTAVITSGALPPLSTLSPTRVLNSSSAIAEWTWTPLPSHVGLHFVCFGVVDASSASPPLCVSVNVTQAQVKAAPLFVDPTPPLNSPVIISPGLTTEVIVAAQSTPELPPPSFSISSALPDYAVVSGVSRNPTDPSISFLTIRFTPPMNAMGTSTSVCVTIATAFGQSSSCFMPTVLKCRVKTWSNIDFPSLAGVIGVDAGTLLALNTNIVSGAIPPDTFIRVGIDVAAEPGDTLMSLAQRYSSSPTNLRSLNRELAGVTDGATLAPGSVYCLRPVSKQCPPL